AECCMSSPAALRAQRLIVPLRELYDQACAVEGNHAADIAAIDSAFEASARNLLHYLAVRQHDIRPLQTELAALGLSSLGRLEAHTLTTLQAVLVALHRLSDQPAPTFAEHPPVTFFTGPMLLNQHSLQLNKGPYVPAAVRLLNGVLERMSTHQAKKRSMLRKLSVSQV
ncbi:MAG: hypothetical protein KDE58_01995, partial [Caldilineaceae bacterium]|nr:hypothetical protein [Caldilineaceae bacterium]